jgi:hypothetical protein
MQEKEAIAVDEDSDAAQDLSADISSSCSKVTPERAAFLYPLLFEGVALQLCPCRHRSAARPFVLTVTILHRPLRRAVEGFCFSNVEIPERRSIPLCSSRCFGVTVTVHKIDFAQRCDCGMSNGEFHALSP